MIPPELISILHPVLAAFDHLGIAYQVGGSLAAMAWGRPRSTQDADLMADLAPAQVPALVAALEADYYIDDLAIYEAIRARRAFNIMHLDTMFKVDIFTRDPASPFDTATFQRARRAFLDDPPPSLPCSPARRILCCGSWSGTRWAGVSRIGNGWIFWKCCKPRRLIWIAPICASGGRDWGWQPSWRKRRLRPPPMRSRLTRTSLLRCDTGQAVACSRSTTHGIPASNRYRVSYFAPGTTFAHSSTTRWK